MIRHLAAALALLALPLAARAADTAATNAAPPAWREDFRKLSPDWKVRGAPGTPKAAFKVEAAQDGDGVLVMSADKASGSLVLPLEGVNLSRTPVVRWRWQMTVYPDQADGRDPKRDDQAIGLYFSTGGMLSQKSVAYRWETDTPVGAEGDARYAAGVVKIHWFGLRNRAGGTNTWFVEERNLAEDFKKAFGFVPEKIGLGVSCNSEMTSSHAEARLDWVEFPAAPKAE